MRRSSLAAILVVVSPVLAGTLEDMDLRSNVETLIRGTAQTAHLHLKITVENSVAIPEGLVRDLNQIDEVAGLAAKVKGIMGVDRSRLRPEFPAESDDELASRVSRTLYAMPKFATIRIAVENRIVTLTGTVKNAAWRGEIRRLCGGIEGVIEVVDRIETPETPDKKIHAVLDSVFGARVVPRFPGYVQTQVVDGAVTLEGHVPRLADKLAAEFNARGINGVKSVDNRLEIRSATAVRVIKP